MDFFVKAKSSTIEGFSTNEGFYVLKNPFVKPSLSINEGFSTIEGFTIKEFQGTFPDGVSYVPGGGVRAGYIITR